MATLTNTGKMTLEELVNSIQQCIENGSPHSGTYQAEMTARQIRIQREATEAQKEASKAEAKAADASVLSAQAAQRNAKYMLASVVVAALSAIASSLSAYYA